MKLVGWYEWCFVVTMWCTITPSCALQDAKRDDFVRCLTKWNSKFEFFARFFWKFQTKYAWHGESLFWHVTACTLVPNWLLAILTRRLNGPIVSIGVEGHNRLINIDRTSTMSIVWIGRQRLFIQITWHTNAISEGFKRFWAILNY